MSKWWCAKRAILVLNGAFALQENFEVLCLPILICVDVWFFGFVIGVFGLE